jgi:hypothetical protein
MEDVDVPITGTEVGVVAKVVGWLLPRRTDPVARLRHNEKIRKELREHLPPKTNKEVHEVVVVRLGRERKYGHADERLLPLGASPWFKFEVKGIGDQGLEVILTIDSAIVERGKAWRAAPGSEDGQTVYVVGRIPYERIRHVDWDADPYYSSPRLYVKYGPRGPCRETVLYEVPRSPSGFFHEIHDVKWKGERGPRRKLSRMRTGVQMSYEARQNKRKMRDGGFDP